MSAIETNGAKNGSNEQMARSYNRKRTVQHPNEIDPSSHTPKRNRTGTFDADITSDQYSSKLHPNPQEIIKTSTTTATPSYFNTYQQQKKISNDTSTRTERKSIRQSFPPFRIILQDPSKYPATEVFIIKELNKFSKLNLTYGRYAKTATNEQSYLLYASTTSQFEHLMCENNWPNMICNSEYRLDLPSKIPSSYSIVVLNVPSQWNAEAFGNELKQHYTSIVRAVRLYVNGGRPLSKVRLDFSSYKELSIILKSKRILLDDDNTAYTVEPYVPPTRVLRCYNCQALDDHIAAHCPNKNDPICFRCAQHHPYNPNCDNLIKCAHCNNNHMAGNPSCPIKAEKRQEKNQRLKLTKDTPSSIAQHQSQVWSTHTKEYLFNNNSSATRNLSPSSMNINNGDNSSQNDIINLLEKINHTITHIKQQQEELNGRFNALDMKLIHYNNEISNMKFCINEILCPLLKEISNQTYAKAKGPNKQIISPLYDKLVVFMSKNNTSTNVDNLSDDKSSTQQSSISNSDQNLTTYES